MSRKGIVLLGVCVYVVIISLLCTNLMFSNCILNEIQNIKQGV